MPGLELFDTVVLKTNRHLVGVIERTHHEGYEQPLQDCLVIKHAEVTVDALEEFVSSGTPPKNHVFVRLSDQALGNYLAQEDDLELLDRSFALGDIVKKEGSTLLGTVINSTDLYTLQPAWRVSYPRATYEITVGAADEKSGRPAHICDQRCPTSDLAISSHEYAYDLIQNVPGEELKKAEDILEGDCVIKDEWLGVVEDLEILVTIQLVNGSIVVVQTAEELYIPVSDQGKPLVTLPEFDSDLRRPDYMVAQQGFSTTVPLPPDDYHSGQFVVTNHSNLRLGRWLKGTYSRDLPSCGRVIDVRAKHVFVRWLTCNAFSSNASYMRRPDPNICLYENINTFPSRTELRRNKKVTVLDPSKNPRSLEDRRRNTAAIKPVASVSTVTDIRVGDYVRFRDQLGAAVKYGGTVHEGVEHGKFVRVPPQTTSGFDLNELKVVLSRQHVTIMWQDGTTTEDLSRTLFRFQLFESDLTPSDIVVAREGMRQKPAAASPEAPWLTFNEMTFFEQPHDIAPQRVGVIQTVDPEERVAQIRWFTSPRIYLLNHGQILSGDSRFGTLSDEVEDVSLYEVMQFDALKRRLKDVVTTVPSGPSMESVSHINHIVLTDVPLNVGAAMLSSLSPSDRPHWSQAVAHAMISDHYPTHIRKDTDYKNQPSLDWVGDIVALGLDGNVTVRVNNGGVCQDVLFEHDQLICFIDETAFTGQYQSDAEDDDDDSMDLDGEMSDDDMSLDTSQASTISETVEYEGGERLDEDSGDDNWEDAEDIFESTKDIVLLDPESEQRKDNLQNHSKDLDSEMLEQTETLAGTRSTPDLSHQHGEAVGTLASLSLALPKVAPAAFEVLDNDPPADQFRAAIDQVSPSRSFLSRILKEHRVLASSLPTGEIFVRTYENRLDLIRCLILGPVDTPYEHAPFLIDLQLGPKWPHEPPTAHFHSWTSGLGRINPNLYEEGKICLSLLGTWQGKSETEGWTLQATILQLLVSLQGLVFVRQPFYNEAGFEGYAEDGAYRTESYRYTEKAFVMARGFVKHALQSPIAGLEDVLAWTYLQREGSSGLLQAVVDRGEQVIQKSRDLAQVGVDELIDGHGLSGDPTKIFLKPLSKGAIVMLAKTIRSLKTMLHEKESTQ